MPRTRKERGGSTAGYLPIPKGEKFGKVMGEFKRGTLHHGSTGEVVPKNRPDIAKAIAASEQRRVARKRRRG